MDVDYRKTLAGEQFVYRVRLGGPLAGIQFNF
jgi:hypothetical protein